MKDDLINKYEELKQQYEEVKQKIKDYEKIDQFKERAELAAEQLRIMYNSMKDQGFDDNMASMILMTILKESVGNG